MVEQSSEPFLLSFLCYLPHTVQPLGHALPTLCRMHVRLNDVLPTSAEGCPPLFGRFTSSTAQSDFSGTCISAVRLLTGLDRQTKACWRSPGSRACYFSACAGSQTTQDRQSTRDWRGCRVAFLLLGMESA